MKPDELYARLLVSGDPTAEIIAMFQAVNWGAARDAAYNAARDAAQGAAYNVAWDAARDAARVAAYNAALSAAWDAARGAARDAALSAALLAGCMVVRDILAKEHMDTALNNACYWLSVE